MALTTMEVTAVSRNSGTRRIREDTQGHDQGANQVQEDTGGPARILKDTSKRRFGTVRPRVQIPGPRPISEYESNLPRLLRKSPGHSRVTISQGSIQRWLLWTLVHTSGGLARPRTVPTDQPPDPRPACESCPSEMPVKVFTPQRRRDQFDFELHAAHLIGG
jgi:hypothetical protein